MFSNKGRYTSPITPISFDRSDTSTRKRFASSEVSFDSSEVSFLAHVGNLNSPRGYISFST